jgi:hypothetical protein
MTPKEEKEWAEIDDQAIRAAISCMSVQHGTHIDSMPTQPPLPPLQYPPTPTTRRLAE